MFPTVEGFLAWSFFRQKPPTKISILFHFATGFNQCYCKADQYDHIEMAFEAFMSQ